MAGYMEGLQGYMYEGELKLGGDSPVASGMIVTIDASGDEPVYVVATDDDCQFMCKGASPIFGDVRVSEGPPAQRFMVVDAPTPLYFVEGNFEHANNLTYDATFDPVYPGDRVRAHRLLPGEEFVTNMLVGEFAAGTIYYDIQNGGIYDTQPSEESDDDNAVQLDGTVLTSVSATGLTVPLAMYDGENADPEEPTLYGYYIMPEQSAPEEDDQNSGGTRSRSVATNAAEVEFEIEPAGDDVAIMFVPSGVSATKTAQGKYTIDLSNVELDEQTGIASVPIMLSGVKTGSAETAAALQAAIDNNEEPEEPGENWNIVCYEIVLFVFSSDTTVDNLLPIELLMGNGGSPDPTGPMPST